MEKVLGLYRDRYFDLNVRHFHEKLEAEHQVKLSYSWVKGMLQGAGLVARERKRGVHRKRRPRRPLPGMLLHIDGSRHRWLQDEHWYDLIVILDDATSEIYYAQLVEEESTVTVMAALWEVIERKGLFCALYSDRGSHFWLTPKAGGAVDPQRPTQVGRALRDLGIQMIPAYSPQARGRSERNFGTWQGRLPQELRIHGIKSLDAANAFLRERYIAEFNQRFQVAAAERGSAFLPRRGQDLERVFSLQWERTVNRDNTVTWQNLALQIERVKWRDFGRLHGHGAPAPGRNLESPLRTALPGTLQCAGRSGDELYSPAKGCGKDGGETALENAPRFPLSHNLGGGSTLTNTGHFTCYKKRTF
jgi:hypothetical protein